MGTTRRQASAPAHDKINAPAPLPFVFEWYSNPVQRDLQHVFTTDAAHRQMLVRIMEEIRDSDCASILLADYQDALETNPGQETNVLLALIARFYVAGTRRGARLFELGDA